MRGSFEARGLVEENASTGVEHPARRREYRLPALEPEGLHAEQLLHPLHGVGHRRLALVYGLRRGRVAAFVDHGDERAPLLEGDRRGRAHDQVPRWIWANLWSCGFNESILGLCG